MIRRISRKLLSAIQNVLNAFEATPQRRRAVLRFECLEDRTVPALVTVTTLDDTPAANPNNGPADANGNVSLRRRSNMSLHKTTR